MAEHETGETTLVNGSLQEPPAPPFKLLHIERAPELDQRDKRAFNVWLELVGLVEMSSPCLYFLAPTESRCGFALAQHAPRTHINQLLMLLVDQDNAYEALSAFEEGVRSRAQNLLVSDKAATPAPDLDALMEFGVDVGSEVGEPPEWLLEPPLEAYDHPEDVPDYGDLHE